MKNKNFIYEKHTYPDGASYVEVKSYGDQLLFHIKKYEDIWTLMQIHDVVRHDNNRLTVIIPNLIDAQADRRFYENHSAGLKIVLELLRSLECFSYVIYHPHNQEVVEAILGDQCVILTPIDFIEKVFGDLNEQNYKVLDQHIGAIYGDSITIERATQICERLKAKGFASTNIVFGIGSYTYQYNTRDSEGWAMKATYGEVLERVQVGTTPENLHWEEEAVGREIFKDPKTDSGEKKSKKGLLQVGVINNENNIFVKDQVTKEEEQYGLLRTVFLNGKLTVDETLETIRERLASYL